MIGIESAIHTVPRDRQWRPYGPGLLPVLPGTETYDWMSQHIHDTRTGAPPSVEHVWNVRRSSGLHDAAWRILLLMAFTGHNLQWDILDAEQDRYPFTDEQMQGQQAVRQKNALHLLRVTGCIEHMRTRIGSVHCVWLRLTTQAHGLLAEAGVEAVESDWDRMVARHDPQQTQARHTRHCLAAARLARGRGWQARLMPSEQPQVDIRLTPPGGGDPIYAECEARAPRRAVRRVRKWERMHALQGICAVVATRPDALADLAREVRLHHRLPVLGTDLETLIESSDPAYWNINDRTPEVP